MVNPLMASLGLDNVDAPGVIADGKYGAFVKDSTYVWHRPKGSPEGTPKTHVSHVITFKINDGGTQNGKEKAEWYLVGEKALDPTTQQETVHGIMPEDKKTWYKKRLMDLGVAENEINTLDVESLKDLKVILGIKNKDGFTNISFVEVNKTQVAPSDGATNLGTLGTLGSL